MKSTLVLARLGLRFFGRSIFHLAQNQKVWIVTVILALGQVSSLAADVTPNTLPTGGQITAGTGSIAQNGNVMVVQQDSAKLVANWTGFDIGSAASVRFNQPNADAIALNRVTGGNPSQILGSLDANGRVFLLNPAGIVFGQTANVNVGGLVASTLSLSDADFLAGRNSFTKSGTAGSIVNQGSVTAAPGGVVAFLAPVIRNDGTLAAPGGDVALAAGDRVDVDFAGDGRLRIRIDLSAVDAEIANHGLIKADGGAVVMSAKSAANLTRAVVNNTGIVEANTVANVNGRIVIDTDLLSNTGTIDASGATGGSVAATAGYALNAGTISARGTSGAGGTILVDAARNVQTSGAVFDASGATQGGTNSLLAGAGEYNGLFSSATVDARGATGGTITLAGRRIDLRGATLDASGTTAGGGIRVGGELHGGAWTDPITGRALTNAVVTDVSPGNSLKASATQGDGTGGRIIVWSDQRTYFYGAAKAQGAGSGTGGFIEVSGKDRLQYGGTVDASSAGGTAGTVLFDPKDIVIDDSAGGGLSYNAFTNPNPGADTQFGTFLVALANGNMVATDPYATAGGQIHAGAAYLFAPDGTLISTLTGSHANDEIGYDLDNWAGGTTILTNDNYVISSPAWNADRGAATWGSNTAGVSGIVNSGNSLVGSQEGDEVGSGGYGAYALSNGNYVIASPSWSDGAINDVGAVTWGNGTSGVTGTISSANSLIGNSADDAVGGHDLTILPGNGNYVVVTPGWDNVGLAVTGAGAATWVDGATGLTSNASNVISSANSIVGDFLNDGIGIGKATALTNGNYVVSSFYWHNDAGVQVGAATWVNGATGLTSNASNIISAANSLVGATLYDNTGLNGISALSNGNYVVVSSGWDNGGVTDVGAVTWGNGATGTAGTVGAANSLLGNTANDSLGNGGITALTNGNYVVLSPTWDRGGIVNAGAATWQDGSTAGTRTLGATIGTANSLVGSVTDDKVGTTAIALDSNGNYVVGSPQYNSGAGAATWVDGSNGHTADATNTISIDNSLIGGSAGEWNTTYNYFFGGDHVGANLTALTNGNYVVTSPNWGGAKGAVTWGQGTTGVVGTISAANSLVGSTIGSFTTGNTTFTDGDKVGVGIFELTNGNFVIQSYDWSDGGLSKVGAVTWVDGTTGLTGTVSSTNSLVGSTADDRVGYGGVIVLSNGNYVVGSPNWDNGAITDTGAATWADGTTGLTGAVDTTNSLVGTVGQKVGGYLLAGTGDTFGVGDGVNYWGVGIYTVSTASSYTGGYAFADNPAALATLTSSQLTSVLNTGSTLVLQANNDITVTSAVTVNNAGGDGGALTLQAGRSIRLNNSITTDNGALTLVANEIGVAGVIDAQRDAGAALITMADGTSINAGTGAVSITLTDGWGKTNTTSGAITLKDITAGSLAVTNFGATAGSDIIADGAVVAPGAISFTTFSTVIQNPGATIAGGAGTVTLNSDSIALNGAVDSISGTGIARLIPLTGSRPIVIGTAGTASDFALDAAELATLADGFSSVHFGQPNQTGRITVSGTLSFNDAVSMHSSGVGGAITLDASAHVNTHGNPIAFYAGSGDSGTFTQANGATITNGSGGLYIFADSVALNGAANSISGSSDFYIYLNTPDRPVILGAAGGAGDLALNTAEIATLANGFSGLAFGVGATTGGVTLGNGLTFHDPLGVYQSAGGQFTINGTPTVSGSLNFGGGGPVALNASVSASTGVTFGGAVTVGPGNLTADAGTGTATFNSTVDHGTNNFRVTADDVALAGNWTGTGARILQPTTVSQTISLAGGMGTFALDATELGYLSNDSPSSVTIGRSGGTGAIAGGAFSFDDPLLLRGGPITQSGDWTLSNALSLQANFANGAFKNITLDRAGNDFGGAVTVVSGNQVSLRDANALVLGASSVSGNLTLETGGALTQTGDLTVTGTTSITAGANDVTLSRVGNDFDGAVTIASGDNVSLRDANALTLGAVTATGTVDIATMTGDLTLAGLIDTDDDTATAITLNAGRSAAAGTATGGNLIVSGGSVNIGAGGIATLYTGSISDSTGLTALVVSGSGRFRYNSDETATNYSTALTAGTNAIYREQPLLSVAPGSESITYGDTTPAFTATLGTAYVNGDASAGTITGTATWTIGGASSTAGHLVAGNLEVGYNTGLISSLGYGFANDATSLNELAIAQRSLAVTGLTTANRAYNATNVAILGGTAVINALGSDDVTLGGTATGTFADKNFGAGKAVTVIGNTISGDDAANYTLVQQTGLTADITKANLVVTGLTAINKTYDATNTATLGGTATITALGSDVVTLGGTATGTFADKNFGAGKAVTVVGNTISGTDAVNYTLIQQTGLTANITPATLSVGYTGVDRVYDTTTEASVTTSDDRLGSDVFTINRTAAFTTKDVANGKIVNVTGVSLTGTDAGNYTLAATAGSTTANITPATLTVGYTGVNRGYDATSGATVTTTDDRLGTDVLTINRSAAFLTKDVANGKTVNVIGVSLSGTDAGNYTVAATGMATANITPATLTVGYIGVNRVYDATTGATVTTSDNRFGSDVLTINRIAAFTTKDVANGKIVNVTGVSLAGADAGNYTVAATGSATANITPATLTVGYTGVNRVYDATTGATVTTSDNRLGSDVLTINRTSAFTTKDVANGKTVNVTGVSLSGTDAGNYTVATTGSTTADITPATLTVGYNGVNRVYDATTGATVTTNDDRLGSDVFTINRTAAFTTKDVANGKSVNVTGVSLSGTDAGNYTVAATGSATADITPATLIVAGLGVANKIYDGTITAVFEGSSTVTALGSDVVALDGSATAAFVDKNVGTGKAVAISGLTLSGADAGNYTIASTGSATADITPKTLTVAFTAADKVYEGTTVATATGSTLTGFVGTETVGVTATAAAFDSKDVGSEKTVTVSGLALTNGANGGLASNYTVSATATTTAAITPATLTYVANPAEAFSAVSLPVLSGTVTGFVDGDTLSNSTTGSALWTSNVTTGSFTGNYAINGSGLLATNYVFVQAAGNATALFLQPVNPVVIDTPRVEPFIRIDGRNQGELYPFEGGTLGLERSALFAPLSAPAPEVIDQRSDGDEKDDENPAVSATTAPVSDERNTGRSAQASAGSTPVAALLGTSGARRHID